MLVPTSPRDVKTVTKAEQKNSRIIKKKKFIALLEDVEQQDRETRRNKNISQDVMQKS